MSEFGVTQDGQSVEAITIGAHGLRATVLSYGAILQDVRLDGVAHGLTLGSDDLADYEGAMQYYGCVVSPVANRIEGASAVIDGQVCTFEANLAGQHTLHSGAQGGHHKVWHIDKVSESHLILRLFMPDGVGGFPAHREITARFEVIEGPILRLTLTTTTDAPSIANATNHSYWNLDGASDFDGHQIRIAADQMLPTDTLGLVTGEVADVAGTAFDFRAKTPIAPANPVFDNTFCVAKDRREITECFWLTGQSGIAMAVSTTEAGIHIYDARDGGYRGIAVEAQGWPDAPNHPHFPSIAVTPEAPVVQITEWRFKAP